MDLSFFSSEITFLIVDIQNLSQEHCTFGFQFTQHRHFIYNVCVRKIYRHNVLN